MSDVVIIGSGLAGITLAKEWRKLDKTSSLTIITQDQGDFYSKPQLSNAFAHQREPDQMVMSTASHLQETLSATFYTHTTVESIDPINKTIQCDNGQRIAYGQLVLANGAKKISPPLQGDALADVQSINNLDDYRHFRQWLQDKKHIAILGAGLVGCEFANDLQNTDCKVTIIAPEAHPLSRLVPEPIGRCLVHAFQQAGVQWNLGVFAESVHYAGDGVAVGLSDESNLVVDGVLSAIGLRADTSLAETAGLTVNRGIVVDRYLRTSNPSIFALGDCAEVNGFCLQYIAPLLQCARALANILKGQETPVRYNAMPVIVKTPLCPIISCLPISQEDGDWVFEGEVPHIRAQWKNAAGELKGFALAGETMRDRMSLLKAMPAWF